MCLQGSIRDVWHGRADLGAVRTEVFMRVSRQRLLLAGFCLLLLAIGPGIELSGISRPAEPAAQKWVRTREGWQRAAWDEKPQGLHGALHPALVALFMALASAGVLIAFPNQIADRPNRGDRS